MLEYLDEIEFRNGGIQNDWETWENETPEKWNSNESKIVQYKLYESKY